MKKALLYERSGEGGNVTCLLCSHQCILKERQTGICRVRKNINGDLFSLNYDKVAATHNDPIEKKPLYHFLPGTASFSIAAMGCNFKCAFCQNYSLSVIERESSIYGKAISPKQIVEYALDSGSQSISYTYSEPTVFFELMLETAQLACEKGLKNIMVTNGFMSETALNTIKPYLHAANVDLKSFSNDFYRQYCGGSLTPVMETIQRMKDLGIWVEVTTLLIPGLNDDESELTELIHFLASVDPGMPWHVSRFYPQHLLTQIPPTPVDSIMRALDKASAQGLLYLYAGNVADNRYINTKCPRCAAVLIERHGYSTSLKKLKEGKCGICQTEIPGVF